MAIKGILRIAQSFSIAGASQSDGLVSYPGHSLEESYPSAEIQSVNSATPTDWAWNKKVHTISKGINPKVNVITRLDFELTY